MKQQLEDLDPMPFGEHKGKLMQDVPASYLHWFWSQTPMNENGQLVHDYITRNLAALKKEHTDGIW